MSVGYTAFAFLGMKLDKNKYYRRVMIPNCKHLIASLSTKFCPECGRQAWTTDYEPIIDIEKSGMLLIKTTDSIEEFVGFPGYSSKVDGDSCGKGDMKPVNYDAVETCKQLIREKLAPHDLWDERSFGLWSVLHCSY